jgi:hypothetical protein
LLRALCRALLLTCACALAASGCGDDDASPGDRDGAIDELDGSIDERDGSTADAGDRDAGTQDAGDRDASTMDAGSDAGDAGEDGGQDAGDDDDASIPICTGDDCPPLLTALEVSSGELDPALDETATDYALAVGLPTQTVTLTATASEGATIEIEGDAVDSGSAWTSQLLDLGDNEITITVAADDYPDRVYTLTVTRAARLAYLKAANVDIDDDLASVAISGDTLVAGAPGEDSVATGVGGNASDDDAADSGAAYVFVRSGGAWAQQAYLKASNTDASDAFGTSVAIAGDTIVVGAPAEDSNATTVGGDGANDDAADSGAAYVFVRSGTAWSPQSYLKAGNAGAGDAFGTTVAVSGDTIVVGAPGEDSDATAIDGADNDDAAQSGAAYAFVRDGSTWTQQAYLKASNAEAGDGFGGSVAISQDTIAVGARLEDSSALDVGNDQANDDAEDSGAVYVFDRDGTTWTQQAYVKAANTDAFDEFGISVAIDGDTLVVGGSLEDSNATTVGGDGANDDAMDSGAAYVYVRSGDSWSPQAYLKASNAGAGDTFGYSVAISGDAVLVGARLEDGSATVINGTDDDAAENSGAAYLFVRAGTTWTQVAYLKASNAATVDEYGESVAISGDTIAVAAPGEDSNTAADPTNNAANESGAVYVY